MSPSLAGLFGIRNIWFREDRTNSIHLVQFNSEETASDVPQPQSLVFIMARPLAVGGSISLSSRGIFPWCHWAVLVCDPTITLEGFRNLCATLNRLPSDNLEPVRLGVCFQLFRGESGGSSSSELDITEPFTTDHLITYFSNCSIAFVGTTTHSLETIKYVGVQILNIHPDYRVVFNNCQNWARYLVHSITGRQICPVTISDILGAIFQLTGSNERFRGPPGGPNIAVQGTSLVS